MKSISVGIPAYNEGANILNLLKDIATQKIDGFKLHEIIVSSDGSTDNTVTQAKQFKDERVSVIDNKDRKGKARGLNQIVDRASGDILVIFDADITINDKYFLHKLVQPIVDDNADLVSSAISELPQSSKTAKILATSMDLKRILFNEFKSGNNLYTCHGLARALSRRFYKNFIFEVSIGDDMYSYLKCIEQGYKYVYVDTAIAYYKLPESISDHGNQSSRFFVTESEMQKHFNADFVRSEVYIPLNIYIKAFFKAIPYLASRPVESFLYFWIQLYMRYRPKSENIKKQAWDMATSSKKII